MFHKELVSTFTDKMTLTSYMCPGRSDPFYIATDYIKWVSTSWTYSNKCKFTRRNKESLLKLHLYEKEKKGYKF